METSVLERPLTAEQIVNTLPQPDYLQHRQPVYPDQQALEGAIDELLGMEGSARPDEITSLQEEFTAMADGKVDAYESVIIMGRCSQPVKLETEIDSLVQERIQALDICHEGLGMIVKALVLRRECTEKPRSAATQKISTTEEVEPHMGDAINGEAIKDRTPTPSRMVAAAIQDRDIKTGLVAAGKHMPAATEALLLPSLKAMIREDPVTKKRYYVGAELPWIGERTRHPDGEHVEALRGIENPVGIKLGPGTTAEQIEQYQEKLNPDGIHGKLVFMLRMGLDHMDELAETLAAIKEYAPHAILMYDVHGSTTTDGEGRKVRHIGRIIEEIHKTAKACKDAGMRLHGIHIETTTELNDEGGERIECVDEDNPIPLDKGGVDPQANPRQTKRLISEVAGSLALAA
jgi:3-deoxy-D-arabino-heptulosonate 7-phosphate (DAHP) synthase class II